MKKYKFIAVLMVLFHFTICISLANDPRTDSLKNLIKTSKKDTTLVNLYSKLYSASILSADHEQIIANCNKAIELSDELGKVNIRETTHALVKDQFSCHYRGEIEAKGKGKVKMYFVEESISQT
jgi:hypothetical protein